jgi:hypothetical protein
MQAKRISHSQSRQLSRVRITTMIHQLPPSIVASRKKACGNCNCGINFEDACVGCPYKRWRPELCPPSFLELQEEREIQQEHNLPFPAASTMASSLVSAVGSEIKAIAKGKKQLNIEDIKKRFAICESCEFFHKPSQRCKKCGCFLKWKTAWRSQKCPIGKW